MILMLMKEKINLIETLRKGEKFLEDFKFIKK